jgi:hypothetical protein
MHDPIATERKSSGEAQRDTAETHELAPATPAVYGLPYIGLKWVVNYHDTGRTVTRGAIDEPEQVAERAAQTPSDPRAARIVAQLLAGNPSPWDLQRIGALGLDRGRRGYSAGARDCWLDVDSCHASSSGIGVVVVVRCSWAAIAQVGWRPRLWRERS